MKKVIGIIFLLFFTISCSKYYSDGDYCAKVEYYNPKTGTHSTYNLTVEVEMNRLTVIHFSNGGWLDNTHFRPPKFKKGRAKFVSDRGYRYNVKILKKGKCK